MGIYIPWMSMPKTCDDCQVSADCPNDEHIDGYIMKERSRFCQVYSVPKHGRLIDADAYLSTIRPICDEDAYSACTFETAKRLMIEHINDAPTIIPADKEGQRCLTN